ncbi:hypothetical protein CORC01_05874 [Colletotrichum orchidophilum]|uniref:Uncharacterized protein n=1 Tax=Colletotrichum orchidophilum TaxID=1209926 RepID=A0A1G4BBS1_9PEZI|nr:uncharacterized protein CORC01_05874 [Colletotrichum orchidophilum]OHE98785.1 hypothetical protein CORC01_05874 [Colletotrichum orchidophilum]
MQALQSSLPRLLSRHKRLTNSSVLLTHLSTCLSLRQRREKHPELLYPAAPSTNHHDIASFLAYANRTGLDVASTVYVGTHYEYTVSSTLAQYGIHAVRVGGVSDQGIDLLGTWKLPSQTDNMKVILQCKAGAQRVGPSQVRELEGSFVGAPVGWRGEGVIAFLVSEKPASKGVRESLGRSRWPMGFISCSREGAVQQMLWNQRADEEGLRGVGVTMRHVEDGKGESQIVLTHNGKRILNCPKAEVSEGN